MMDYTIRELEEWNRRIEAVIAEVGLDCYPQEYEICSYEDMLCYETYVGMPSHYPHWSYGKAYEKNKTLYSYDLKGLAYEMVINANPCVAYLMRDNTLLLQILTMAHVYGHNDFFKNNRLFAESTRAETSIEMFKNHASRIRNYIQDPSIGYQRVERILDAAHAIRFQTTRECGIKRLSTAEIRQHLLDKYAATTKVSSPLESKKEVPFPDLHKIPLEPTDDLIGFIAEYGKLEDWERDIITIVMEETDYFLPQIETKIMNEGWASFWHYRILHKLELPQDLYMEFLTRHNQVIRPFTGGINPYYLGFKIFADIEQKYGLAKLFEVRKIERDQSFLRRYLTAELCDEMNLFQYNKKGRYYEIEEVADEKGWREIRNTLANDTGLGGVPVVKVLEVSPRDRSLWLEQEYDGRELERIYTFETLKHLVTLWEAKVYLKTYINGNRILVTCDENKSISMNEW